MTRAINIFHGPFGRVALLDMDQPLIAHAHHHCHVLIKASGGDQRVSVRGEGCPMRDDTAVLINAWAEHAYPHDPATPDVQVLALYIEPQWLSRLDSALQSSMHPAFFERPCVRITPRIRGLADRLSTLLQLGVHLPPDEAEAMIVELMLAVIDRFSQWRAIRAARVAATATTGASDFRIRRAVAAMREDPAAAVDLGRVARAAGLSRPHFFQLFKRCTGLTPLMYANHLRVEQAVRALSSGDGPIADIGLDLGFDAQGNFSRFFRQNTGVSPRDYRMAASVAAANNQTLR
ncbi:helix-turn-helix transcriptional regulator [Azospirillum sp. ST 5-10]|uniref:helix-turn-helix transcriptional regulator n=1 Tax=unclassified Azospirillum TaxID=2630922 RepID=UPI003F4A44D4